MPTPHPPVHQAFRRLLATAALGVTLSLHPLTRAMGLPVLCGVLSVLTVRAHLGVHDARLHRLTLAYIALTAAVILVLSARSAAGLLGGVAVLVWTVPWLVVTALRLHRASGVPA